MPWDRTLYATRLLEYKIMIIDFPLEAYRNGSQLAKMKREYSWHAPAMKFTRMKQLV